jgi:ABC-type multidrug transport system fused ATPase/permease subunit
VTTATLGGLLRAAVGRVALLALLDFGWFMILPLTVGLFVDSNAGIVLPLVVATSVEVARLFVRQRVRRGLRDAFMSSAARRALLKDETIAEVRSDAAFWGAHIAEYAVSLDAPTIVGAGAATALTLAFAVQRSGLGLILEIGAVLLGGVILGVLSNRLRRRGVDKIVDQRQLTATWMAAAVRDHGELASPRATARFLEKLSGVTMAWCAAEEVVERARSRHRLAIAAACGLALYAVARHHGIDLLSEASGHEMLSSSLSGTLLLGSCFPAAYAFAAHLESISVANSELSRLALKLTTRPPGANVRLAQRPLTLSTSGATTRHEQLLALELDSIEVKLRHVVGIAGPNGSGKTTFARLISGVRSPSSGSLLVDGVPATDVSRDDVAFVPQDPVLVESLSIAENICLVAPDCDLTEAAALLHSLGLAVSLDKPAGSLSRGEQRRIAIARAFLKRPKLLVLDEPDAWLDVAGRRSLIQALTVISREASVFVVSHRPDVLLQLETIIVLNELHQVEGIDGPSQLRVASPSFRALLGGEPPEGTTVESEARC